MATGNNSVDMLHGPLLGKMLKVAMPFAASNVLQQLFISIDVAVVGHFASSEALAAVGANTFLINLLINLFVGIAVGANAVIAYAMPWALPTCWLWWADCCSASWASHWHPLPWDGWPHRQTS